MSKIDISIREPGEKENEGKETATDRVCRNAGGLLAREGGGCSDFFLGGTWFTGEKVGEGGCGFRDAGSGCRTEPSNQGRAEVGKNWKLTLGGEPLRDKRVATWDTSWNVKDQG